MTLRVAFLFFLLFSGAASAFVVGDTVVVREAQVVLEHRADRAWTRLTGRVEATTDVSVERLVAVLTDWASYPRLFPKIQKVQVVVEARSVLLTEETAVSVLGFSVKNRFTIRLVVGPTVAGTTSIRWTQEWTDGTIDGLEGGWDLESTNVGGRAATLIRYRTVSSVPQTVPGQEGLVGLFFPGELRQILASVLSAARQEKERQ